MKDNESFEEGMRRIVESLSPTVFDSALRNLRNQFLDVIYDTSLLDRYRSRFNRYVDESGNAIGVQQPLCIFPEHFRRRKNQHIQSSPEYISW